MNKAMGICTGFDFIKTEDMPRMIEWAFKESNPVYPVPVIYTRERFRKIIEIVRSR